MLPTVCRICGETMRAPRRGVNVNLCTDCEKIASEDPKKDNEEPDIEKVLNREVRIRPGAIIASDPLTYSIAKEIKDMCNL